MEYLQDPGKPVSPYPALSLNITQMIIDIIFIVLILMAVFQGYSRGFIVALFSILAFVIGIAAAMKLSTVVAHRINENMSVSPKWLPFISFVIVFIIVVILVRLGAQLIEKTFQLALLGWANRLAGILLFAILYTLLFSIILFYATKINIVSPETVAQSVIYPYVEPLGPKVINGIGQVIPVFKNMFIELGTFFENLAKKGQ